jgi:hypothetical protein
LFVNQLNVLINLLFTSSWLSDCDISGVGSKKSLDHLLDFRDHSGTEHMHNLIPFKGISKYRLRTTIVHDILNLLRKILTNHLISLINNNPRKPLQRKMSLLHHLLNPARRPNNNISTLPQTDRLQFHLITPHQTNTLDL